MARTGRRRGRWPAYAQQLASTRNDAQAKSLGEWLRASVVDLPEVLSAGGQTSPG